MAVKPPLVIVLMGVSGCGKSTTGAALSRSAGLAVPRCRQLPSARQRRQDEPRRAARPTRTAGPGSRPSRSGSTSGCAAGERGIVSCSALKRAYRSRIIGARSDVRLVYLKGDMDLIGQRLRGRKHHFMPASLLESQFATLEEPGADERRR